MTSPNAPTSGFFSIAFSTVLTNDFEIILEPTSVPLSANILFITAPEAPVNKCPVTASITPEVAALLTLVPISFRDVLLSVPHF